MPCLQHMRFAVTSTDPEPNHPLRCLVVQQQPILNIENWIGADQFQKGMARYAKKYAWKNTDAFDLARALRELG